MSAIRVLIILFAFLFILFFCVELTFYLALKKDPYTDDDFIEEQLKILEEEMDKRKAERSKDPW